MENKTIYYVKKQEDAFIVVDKRFLTNNQISLGAKGLYLTLMAFRQDKIFIDDFVATNTDDAEQIEEYILELKNAGYLDKLL